MQGEHLSWLFKAALARVLRRGSLRAAGGADVGGSAASGFRVFGVVRRAADGRMC
jgi:hypothetical protein